MRHSMFALVSILAITSAAVATNPPQVLHILAIGEVDPSYCPIYGFCAAEPSLDVTLAVARSMHGTNFGEKELQRMIRLYVPRNLEAMLRYNFIIINQPIIRLFPLSSLEAMYSAIADHGVGSLCFMESQSASIYVPWLETRLSECYPYDHYKNIAVGAPDGQPYNLEVVRDPALPPLLRPFLSAGIENVKPFGYARPTFPREGATIWAYCRTNYWSYRGFTKFPLFISWRYGQARALTWVTADQFDSPMWRAVDGRERYQLDIFTGIVWLSSGRSLPSNPLLVHQIRNSFSQITARIGTSYAVLDFIDEFGANTRRLETRIATVQKMKEEAGKLYLEHRFDEAASKIQETFSELDRIDSECVELKRRALLWVHLVEWLGVSSTLALTGSVIWAVMVKRKLYRPVESTRMAAS